MSKDTNVKTDRDPPQPDTASQSRKRGWVEPEVVTFAMKTEFTLRLVLMLIWLIVSSILALPLCVLRWKNPNNNNLFGYLYGDLALKILGVRTSVEGREHWLAHQPCIYVSNHQSGADMPIFATLFPRRTLIIGKKELLYIPVWGFLFEAFGNIRINRKNRTHAVSGLKQAVETLKEKGLSIYIFPEGTRNGSGIGLLPFKRGAFHMAIAAQVPIVPMVCSSLAKLINFQRKYARPGTLFIRILPPIETRGRTVEELDLVMAEVRQKMIDALAELNERP